MKMLKKIISSFIIFAFIINLFGTSLAYYDLNEKEYKKYSIEVKKNYGNNFIDKLDNKLSIYKKKINSLNKNSKNKILEKFYEKIDKAIIKTEDERKKSLLLYIKYYFLFNFGEIGINSTEIETKNEFKQVEKEILNLQKNIFESGVDFYKSITSEINDLLKLKQTGDIYFDLNADIKGLGKIDSDFSLTGVTVITSGFDSHISGNIKGSVDYFSIFNEQESISGNIETFFDFIAKDENLYVLLKNFGINVNTKREEIKTSVEDIKKVVKELFKNNTYAQIVDENSKEALELLKTISPSEIIYETEKAFKKPLFEVEKKVGNKYILKPTRFACETYFKLEGSMSKINPFYQPGTCTDFAFDRFKKTISEFGDLYIILGDKENTIGFDFDVSKDEDLEKANFTLKYDKNNINYINFVIIPDQKAFKDQGIYFNYIKNKKITFDVNAQENDGFFKIKLLLNLDNKNKISSGDFKIDMNIDENIIKGEIKYKNNLVNGRVYINIEDLTGNIEIKNSDLTGKFEIETKSYDYATYKYKKNGNIVFNLVGKIDSNLNFKNLGLKVIGKKEEKEYLNINSKINFIGDKIVFTNNFNFKDDESGDYKGNLNIEYESSKQKEILNIDLKVNGDRLNINGTLKSNFKKEYGNYKIKAPSRFQKIDEKKMEEIMDEY